MDPLGLLILSAALQAGGNVIQKQRVAARVPNVSLGQMARRLGGFFRPLLRDPWWVLGVLLGLAGSLVGLQALAVMDLSVLKALGRVETVFVILAGVLFLGERIRASEALGLLLLTSGLFVLALHAGGTGGVAPREAHLVLVAGMLGLLGLAVLIRRRNVPWIRPELALAGAAGALFGTGDILTKGATAIAKAGAVDGRFSVIEANSMGALFHVPEFGLAIAAYVAGTILMQGAFSVGRVSVIGPVTAMASLLVPIVFGLVVLREDAGVDRLLGIVAIILATLLLGRRKQPGVAGV